MYMYVYIYQVIFINLKLIQCYMSVISQNKQIKYKK